MHEAHLPACLLWSSEPHFQIVLLQWFVPYWKARSAEQTISSPAPRLLSVSSSGQFAACNTDQNSKLPCSLYGLNVWHSSQVSPQGNDQSCMPMEQNACSNLGDIVEELMEE